MTPKRLALLPVELWEQLSAPLPVVMRARGEYSEPPMAKFEAEGRDVPVWLTQASRNSSQPPSSEGPPVKRKPPKPASGRKAGGQPGQTPHQRAFVPVAKVGEVLPCKPHRCRRCGKPLTASDPAPWRPPVVELPLVRPPVMEYQRQRVKCARCGMTTCGALPPGVWSTCYGPRPASVVARCTGGDREQADGGQFLSRGVRDGTIGGRAGDEGAERPGGPEVGSELVPPG